MRIRKINGMTGALAISLMALGMAGTASAAFTACPTAAPPLPYQIGSAGSITAGAFTDTSFTCGGLTFSNFSEVNAGQLNIPNPWSGHVDLASASAIPGEVDLGFNPNISFTGAGSADLWFFFEVTGAGLDQIDLSVTGTGSSVSETVCSATFNATGGCTGTQLATLSNANSTVNWSNTYGPVSTIYILKDIHVGGTDANPGHLTILGQSFHTSSVPEPATLSMMGLGLLGLGLIGRRRKS